jgi:hypothetical protein
VNHTLKKIASKNAVVESSRVLWAERAKAVYAGLHSHQRRLIDSAEHGYKYLSLRCPRRAGKTRSLAGTALYWGEKYPGSRILIISLTLKSTVDNYWAASPSGLFAQNDAFQLGIKWNATRFSWVHENGSRGHLAGAETIADIEKIRGALAEADVAIVDECKSFAPDLLLQLLRDVLLPGLMTRNGILILGGTPGSIPVGYFYEATSSLSRNTAGLPTCIPLGSEDDEPFLSMLQKRKRSLWRLHSWTLKENLASPGAWDRALDDKERMGWEDDNPVWRREYLGEWVTDTSDLVYAYASHKHKPDYVTWTPQPTKINPSGLPQDLGPWRYVLGLDLGFVDDSAFVLCAYSEQLKQLRHVYDFKAPGLTIDAFFDEVFTIIDKYGRPDAIVADTAGGGSKMLVETLNQRYGLGVEPAKKTEKADHIELVNSDFAGGRIKIIPGSDLAMELSGLQWDLSRDSKAVLSRLGRLKEDPTCPNHLCDALLYLYRFSYHFWSEQPRQGLEPNTDAWFRQMEAEAVERAVARKRGWLDDAHNLRRYESGSDIGALLTPKARRLN